MRQQNENENLSVVRIWRGWTSKENADALEKILRTEAIPSIVANKPNGLKAINLLMLDNNEEVQFTTIMYFDSINSVKQFAGEDYSHAHIDPAVAPLLLRYDKIVEHHILNESRAFE